MNKNRRVYIVASAILVAAAVSYFVYLELRIRDGNERNDGLTEDKIRQVLKRDINIDNFKLVKIENRTKNLKGAQKMYGDRVEKVYYIEYDLPDGKRKWGMLYYFKGIGWGTAGIKTNNEDLKKIY